MKRIDEKVKDIVEVCQFQNLHDFAADASLTLAGYYFTDITADLMVKWLDRIAATRSGNGTASALAGFRGVGKSHFLAAIGAILSRPELRSGITDAYVHSAAERLPRRHHMVGSIARGSGPNLLSELKGEIARLIDVDPGTLSDSLYDLLLKATEKCGDQPLVLLFDTAVGRRSRVERDDGEMLGEIAEAAKTLGIFVGVALDDDISGADGPNASVSRCYTIDFLDSEHLYKIVDSRIFSKHRTKLPVLHDIYDHYRSIFPGFRWSEQRFSALYPLHPATLEIAPLIRLYIYDFALLGFAAEAGVRILGRPANSLIGIDEMFDSVEAKLRGNTELAEAFAGFDLLERDVIGTLSVQQRLLSKLVLKGLFMMSLNAQGVTAQEIAAAMVIDEKSPDAAGIEIDRLLDALAAAQPKLIRKTERENGAPKFLFVLDNSSETEEAISTATRGVSEDEVYTTLKKLPPERFAGSDRSASGERTYSPCAIEWRGGIRRGIVFWNGEAAEEYLSASNDVLDWAVFVRTGRDGPIEMIPSRPLNTIVWRAGDLLEEEKSTLRRHFVLQTSTDVRELLNSGSAAAAQVSSMAVEKIWNRVFLEDGTLEIAGESLSLSPEAGSAFSLPQLFTIMLEPLFEKLYPEHPHFTQTFGGKQASALLTNFFGGANVGSPESQMLAEVFAAPLGLAVRSENEWACASAEQLSGLPAIASAIDPAALETGNVIPLADVNGALTAYPYGYTRESIHAILSALASQRSIEFVTSSGNRINHRSLDLQILWEDIVGVAKPLSEQYSLERLLSWAKVITGNAGLRSVDRSEDRLLIIDSLSGWLNGWHEHNVIAAFDALPDESMTAAGWKIAASLRKSLGAMAELIEALVSDEISLDECLHSVAGLFADSHENFESKKSELRTLRTYVDRAARSTQIASYLALCEPTDNIDIENCRILLLRTLGESGLSDNAVDDAEIDRLWAEMRSSFSEYHRVMHDRVMASNEGADLLRERLGSPRWSVFEAISMTAFFDIRYRNAADRLIGRLRRQQCRADAQGVTAERPTCSCNFRLADAGFLDTFRTRFDSVVELGLASFARNLETFRKNYRTELSGKVSDQTLDKVIACIEAGGDMTAVTAEDIAAIRAAGAECVAAVSLSADVEVNGLFYPDHRDAAADRLDDILTLSGSGRGWSGLAP